MVDYSEFRRGWEYSSKQEGVVAASSLSSTYVDGIIYQIDNIASRLNSYAGSRQSKAVLGGFIAEEWHAGTFNLNATAAESANRAFVEKSTEQASVDVSTNFDNDYSLKYLKNADKSIKAQSKNVIQNYYEYLNSAKARGTKNPMRFDEYCEKYDYSDDLASLLTSVYSGQGRIIPSDQLKEGIEKLKRLIATESARDNPNRLFNLNNYLETLENLADRIKDSNGVESIPLSKTEAEHIAELCRTGDFKPEDFGLTIDKVITTQYLLRQCLKGGITSATLTLAIQSVPKIVSLISQLIKNKRINKEEIKQIGLDSLSSSTKSFVIGFLTCGLYLSCKKGKLGTSLVSINAPVLGSIVALTLGIWQNCLQKGMGTLSSEELRYEITQNTIQMTSSLLFGKIATSLFPTVVGVAFSIGSLFGSVLGSLLVNISDKIIVSLCVDSGYTLFGVVKQDYQLPVQILKEMGLSINEINRIQIDYSTINRNTLNYISVNYNNVDRIRIRILKRGIIEFHKVGYIF